MNKFKFTNYDRLGKAQNVILTTNEGTKILHWWPHTMYWNKEEQKYSSIKEYYKINNEIYV